MSWGCKTFNELTLDEFYQILKLRIDVFVVEQKCIYHELDGKDKKAHHLFTYNADKSKIIAYSRIFEPGVYFEEAAFGRVVVHPAYRNKNLGRLLIKKSLTFIETEFAASHVKISAQTHLKKLYESFDFEQISDPYLDDGIPHIDMLKH